MDMAMQAWLDQEDAHVAAMVRAHGWFIQYVGGGTCGVPTCGCGDDGPAFAYTVGLFGLRHPELLILGVPPEVAGAVLNDLGRRIKNGAALLSGQLVTFRDRPQRIIPEVVPNPEEIVYTANRFYGMASDASVPVLQLSYDDPEGRFPWEPGYPTPALQPRPGTFRA